MTQTARTSGYPFTIFALLLLLLGPGVSVAAEDMWSSVFAYQQKMAGYGNPEAQVKLGEMYEEGHGTAQDYDMAQQWYQKASDQGFAPAKEKLKKLELRRKKEAEAKQRAEQERIAEEKMAREREARKKAAAAERAKREQEDKERQAREKEKKRRAEKQAAKEAEEKQLAEQRAAEEEADKAKKEAEARKRAEEAIKEMMSVPSGYSEE